MTGMTAMEAQELQRATPTPAPARARRRPVRHVAWHKALAVCCLAVVLLAAPAGARAADDPEEKYDARLEGYGSRVALPSSNTALMWILFCVLAVIATGALFKSAKRSHLD